jgi:hypothetical protein
MGFPASIDLHADVDDEVFIAALLAYPGPGLKHRGRVITWDLDSTIAHTGHRQHMVAAIKDGHATWDDYSLACDADTPISGTVQLMRLLKNRYQLIIVTGRSEVARAKTEAWLRQHDVPCDQLIMRAQGSHEPNGRFKVGAIRQLEKTGCTVLLHVEDWPEAADYIREHTGLMVLCVNPEYEPSLPHANINEPL